MIITVIVIGLSGIAAQVLLLREFLVSFYGNELTLGIILANWLVAEALGVFLIGRIIERVKNKIRLFISLEIIFSVLFPALIYLTRTFKNTLGIPLGEGVGLAVIFGSTFLIILPAAFCHGALFSASCKLFSLNSKDSVGNIGMVYAFETVGTILGGIILTFVFIPWLNSFQTVYIVSVVNLVICFVFLRLIIDRKSRLAIFSLLCILLASFVMIPADLLHNYSLGQQFKTGKVLAYRNSVYGNIVATQNQSQHTFFYNGIPIITAPYPDIAFVEELSNFGLLFHPRPKNVLIISAGAGGLINEVLKHPVNRIEYVELDPLLISMLKSYAGEMILKELSDPRVNVINSDPRYFLKNTFNRYDLVIFGISAPTDLATNRLFTEEFFEIVKKRLNPEGIMELWLPGSLVYISNQLRDLNYTIINSVKKAFDYIRIIPGDYNLIFASQSDTILKSNALSSMERKNADHILTKVINPKYLSYRLDEQKLEWFNRSTKDATSASNKDFQPTALFEMLLYWNRQFSPNMSKIFEDFKHTKLATVSFIVLILTLILACVFYFKPKASRSIAVFYSIATSGFYGMLINLIFIFSFQVFYGYLINKIGLLIALFMAGTALGSFLISRNLKNNDYDIKMLIRLDIWISVFTLVSALILNYWQGQSNYGLTNFMALIFISGAFLGFEFPLANKIVFEQTHQIGTTSGLLYLADLLGGWFAAILGGIIFLPIIGLLNSCILIILLKISSTLLLILANGLKQDGIV